MGQFHESPRAPRIVRGPYLEALVLMPGKSKPQIIVRYGAESEYTLTTFDQAAQAARKMVAVDRLVSALRAVQQFNNGERDDFERVADQVDAVLALIETQPTTF